MDIQGILALLPHRYPFILVDRVVRYVPDFSLVAIKNVTINEPFFPGHFPVRAVMPGVLILEALAQAAAILASQSEEWKLRKPLFYLAGIENARFKKVVVPGDQLHLSVELTKRKSGVWKFKGTALVDGQVVCTAEMTSAEGKGDS